MAVSSMATGDFTLTAGPGLTIGNNIYPSWSSIDLDLKNNSEFQEIQKKISAIEERLCIINPNYDLIERFPALKEAYDHYKLIEKLVNDNK